MNEPHITINGFGLTSAQAMAVRVAITSFHAEMSDPLEIEALGPIGTLYRERLTEVLRLILPQRPQETEVQS